MANVDLKSLTIQGLDDTYIIPQNLNEMAGTLDVDKGGTGVNSIAELKEALNIGAVASEDVVPISKGGTGATTAQQARENLGIINAADYIVERGTSGIWNYTKWNSGKITLEVCKVSINPTAVTTIGEFYCYYWYVVPPQNLLVDNPSNGYYSFKATSGYDVGGGIQLYRNAITMYGMSTASVTTSSSIITNLTIEGLWK